MKKTKQIVTISLMLVSIFIITIYPAYLYISQPKPVMVLTISSTDGTVRAVYENGVDVTERYLAEENHVKQLAAAKLDKPVEELVFTEFCHFGEDGITCIINDGETEYALAYLNGRLRRLSPVDE